MKVLVVDDEQCKVDVAVNSLNKLSITDIIVKDNFIDAINFLAENKVDFIILDMRFPSGANCCLGRIAGLELLKELSRTENKTPVICFSSGSTSEALNYPNTIGYILFSFQDSIASQIRGFCRRIGINLKVVESTSICTEGSNMNVIFRRLN